MLLMADMATCLEDLIKKGTGNNQYKVLAQTIPVKGHEQFDSNYLIPHRQFELTCYWKCLEILGVFSINAFSGNGASMFIFTFLQHVKQMAEKNN